MTIRDVLEKESNTISLMILHSTSGCCKYWFDPDCLIYTGREEIIRIEDEVLNLSVIQYNAARMTFSTLLTIWI